MATLTHDQAALLEGPNFAVVATVKPDGTPQTSVVWIDWDGENVVFNTVPTRAKGKNLVHDPRVSITVWDNEDPYRYVEIEGNAELDPQGAAEHIHKLSRKYRGEDYPSPDGRVIVRVRPTRVHSMGID
jgi:PPOX class probable F420-dependent enzyme